MVDTVPHPQGDAEASRPVGAPASALVVGVAAVLLFAILRAVVAMGELRPLPIDLWWHDLMGATLTEALIVVAWVPAVVGGTAGMIVIGLGLVAVLALRHRRGDAATLALAMVAVVGIGAPLAAVIARIRPADSLAESVATSFPSGHTAVATTVAIVLGLILRRTWVWIVGAGWVVLMMWSRTYLHAHWLSDVVAGLLEGVAVACLTWWIVSAVRVRRARSSATMEGAPPDDRGADGS